MVNYRGLSVGSYINGGILLPYEQDYYIIGLSNIISAKYKEEVYRLAVSKQLEKPELLYEDNEEKFNFIAQTVEDMGAKFREYFKNDEIITTTQYVDELLSGFNDFVEEDKCKIPDNLDELIKQPDKYAYFDVKEVTSGVSDFVQAAENGFSSHEKVYDVGIIYDSNMGLLVLPFYGTFKQIFSVEDCKSIEGYKECIQNYFLSDKIPPAPILNICNQNKDKFVSIVKEVFGQDNSIEEILHTYKESYYNKRKFSSPTILYSSKTFADLMENARVHEKSNIDISQKTGRNDPCPCGSGKKYKKCCLV